MAKLKVYVVLACSNPGLEERIYGIHLTRDAAEIEAKRLRSKYDVRLQHIAVLKRTVLGDYWLSARSGLMFINGRRVKKVVRNHLGE